MGYFQFGSSCNVQLNSIKESSSGQSQASVYGGHQWELFLFEKRADNSIIKFFYKQCQIQPTMEFLRDVESKSGVNLDLTPFIQGDLPLFCQNDRSGVLGVCKNDKIFPYFNGAVRFSSIIALCFMFICNIKVFQCVRQTFIVCGCESRLCPIAHTSPKFCQHIHSDLQLQHLKNNASQCYTYG